MENQAHSDSRDDRRDDLAGIVDPEEYYQRRRLEEIGDARLEARQVKQKARERQVMGHMSQTQAQMLYQSAVEGYITEVEPLLLDKYADEGGAELWHQETLGTIEVEPPEEFNTSNSNHAYSDEYAVEPRRVEFIGLSSIINTDTPLTVTFEGTTQSIVSGSVKERETVEFAINERILDKAVRKINRFLSEIGMDVEAGESKEWEI